jgi:hypothetical protein
MTKKEIIKRLEKICDAIDDAFLKQDEDGDWFYDTETEEQSNAIDLFIDLMFDIHNKK